MRHCKPRLSIDILIIFCFVCAANVAWAAPGATPVVDTIISAPLTGDDAVGPPPPDSAGFTGDPAVAFGSSLITITNESFLLGGDGSDAGSINLELFSLSGGIGGAGISFNNQDGASSILRPVFINAALGTVMGGNGGSGTPAGDPASAGAGGSGILSDADFALINNYGLAIGGIGGVSDYGGLGGSGIELQGTGNIVNNYGTVTGGTGGNGGIAAGQGGQGISGIGTVNNFGTINGGTGGTVPGPGTTGRAVQIQGTLNNTGIINGIIGGSITINNTGTITGSINTFSGNDTINMNGGIINATTISLSTGLNSLNVYAGTINGNVSVGLSAQADTLLISGGTLNGNVNLGNGANIMTINGGVLNGNLTTGTGIDTFSLSGGQVTGSVTLGTGNDIFNLSGGTINSGINMGGGYDTVSFATSYTLPTSFLISQAEQFRVVSGGILDFEAARALNSDFTVNSGGRANITSGSLTAVNSLVNNGTILIGAGNTLASNTFLGGSGEYIFEVASSVNTGRLAFFNQYSLTGMNLSIQTTAGASLSDNDEILIIDGTIGPLFGFDNNSGQALTPINDNSLLWDFSVADGSQPEIITSSDNADLYVLVNQVYTLGAAASTGNNFLLTQALDPLLANSTNQEITAINTQINNASSVAELNTILDSLQPALDRSPVILNSLISGRIGNQIGGRIDYLRQSSTDMPDTSFQSLGLISPSSGNAGDYEGEDGSSFKEILNRMALSFDNRPDLPQNKGIWVKGFGSKISQNEIGDIAGFNADVYGATLGVDYQFMSGQVVGMALSFAEGDIDSENANNTQTDLQTYQVSLYGERMVTNNIYLQGTASYAWSDIESARSNIGGIPLTAYAEYTNERIGLDAAIGQVFNIGQTSTLNFSGLANYSYFGAYDYIEYGAGGIGLSVGNDSTQILELGLNLDIASDIQQEDGSILRPFFKLGYRYDVIGEITPTTSNFIAGGATFQPEGADPDRGTGNIGVGLNYISTENWDLGAEYDYEYRNSYNSHSAQLTARWKF